MSVTQSLIRPVIERRLGPFDNRPLEHDPEKWKPVFRKDHAQTRRWDRDAISLSRIM